MSPTTLPRTFGDLKNCPWADSPLRGRTVRDELRANLLARLDQGEGLLGEAAFRWERALADDIDDPEALRNLRLLRPTEDPAVGTAAPAWLASTLLTPEGVDLQRYRLVHELGRGASGVVYLARDTHVGREVALKILHPSPTTPARRASEARFFSAQRALARLRHPALVAILALDPVTRSLTLELMPRGSLRDRLRQRARETESAAPDVDEAALTRRLANRADEVHAFLRRLAGGLTYVHEAGLLHGDIKPGNILLRGDDSPALADFAGVLAGSVSTEAVPGTPLYFAPELFRGGSPSAATDAFALGAVGWEVLNGAPWRIHADLLAGRYDARPPLRVHAIESTPALAALLARIDALTADEPAARLAALAAAADDEANEGPSREA